MSGKATIVILIGVGTVSLFGTPVAAQSAPNGAAVFKRACSVCHANAPGAPSRLGPNLSGVAGKKAGSRPGFSYSKALAQSGLVWNAATLDRFITKPSAVVPGTKMGYSGLSDPADRRVVVDYIRAATK